MLADAYNVACAWKIFLPTLADMGIKSIHVRMDGAGCFRNHMVMDYLRTAEENHGVAVDLVNFGESQGNKTCLGETEAYHIHFPTHSFSPKMANSRPCGDSSPLKWQPKLGKRGQRRISAATLHAAVQDTQPPLIAADQIAPRSEPRRSCLGARG